MNLIKFSILVTAVALFAGCATVTPNELVNARSAYHLASAGPAAHLAPAELHQAREALALAEEAYRKDHDSYKTRDLAYVAQRKAELARASGVMAADRASKAKADADFQRTQTELLRQGRQDLTDSEGRTADALAQLAQLTGAREDRRGLVVTLSGNVLFRSGESTLLPTANARLDRLADALLAADRPNLVIEGHTDSQGSSSYNQGLSERRADAVRNYLVRRGYPSEHIRTVGMGQGSPIADNASPEGRANNRRVEIIIQHHPDASSQYTSSN